jgi:hypothetical protein
VRVVRLLIGTPVEVDPGVLVLQLPGVSLGQPNPNRHEFACRPISHEFRENTEYVLASEQLKARTVIWKQEMVVAGYAVMPDKDSAATSKRLIAVDPDREVLPRLGALEIDVQALYGLT